MQYLAPSTELKSGARSQELVHQKQATNQLSANIKMAVPMKTQMSNCLEKCGIRRLLSMSYGQNSKVQISHCFELMIAEIGVKT